MHEIFIREHNFAIAKQLMRSEINRLKSTLQAEWLRTHLESFPELVRHDIVKERVHGGG